MANNAFDAYMMFNNGFRKAIVKAPEHAAGTVVDIVVDGVDKVEQLAGNTRTALLLKSLRRNLKRKRRLLISSEKSYQRHFIVPNQVTECMLL